MSNELSILALYGLLIVVVLLVQVLLASGQVGLAYLATPRDERKELEGIPARALRCLDNSITAMALFAPAIFLLEAKGAFTATTLLVAQAFLVARAAYVVVYLAGIPWLRTGIWMIGFLATAYLYLLAL